MGSTPDDTNEPPKPASGPEGAPDPSAVSDVRSRISIACSFCHGKTSPGEAVFCATCLAPHHADCFRTHGRCSVAGCGEQRTVRPAGPPGRPSSRTWLVPVALSAAVALLTVLLLMPARDVDEEPRAPQVVVTESEAGAEEAPAAPRTLFGRPLDSRALVLALDISSSMRVIDLAPGETWTDDHGKPHTWRDPGLGPPEERSRFSRMKREVVRLINTLRSDTSFGVVLFGTEARTWRNSLVPATPSQRRAAAAFVNGVPWEAGTVTGEGLELAFGLGPDTIALVTDGVPERTVRRGVREDVPRHQVIELSRAMNPGKRVRLHCYGFFGGSDAVHRFLHELAAAHDGEYRDILPE